MLLTLEVPESSLAVLAREAERAGFDLAVFASALLHLAIQVIEQKTAEPVL